MKTDKKNESNPYTPMQPSWEEKGHPWYKSVATVPMLFIAGCIITVLVVMSAEGWWKLWRFLQGMW